MLGYVTPQPRRIEIYAYKKRISGGEKMIIHYL